MKLKNNLLIDILDNRVGANKYSKSFLNLKNVLDLEEKAKYKFKDKSVYTKFNKLKFKFYGFINGVPLVVVERYFNDNKENINKFVYLEFQDNEVSDLKIMELFNLLEEFYQECFSLACLIADLYNFEVKFNDNDSSDEPNKMF